MRCVFDFVLIGCYRLGHGANDQAAPTTIYYLTGVVAIIVIFSSRSLKLV